MRKLYNIPSKLIGVTGPIACGKTTFCKKLEEEGRTVIYADKLVKKIYEYGPVVETMFDIEEFHNGSFMAEGGINFHALRDQAFRKPELLKSLETLVEPFMEGEFLKEYVRLGGFNKEEIYYEHPLIFQRKIEDRFDNVILLTVSKEEQIERIVKRDGCSERVAKLMVAVQEGRA